MKNYSDIYRNNSEVRYHSVIFIGNKSKKCMDTGDSWCSVHGLGVLRTKSCSYPQRKNTIKDNNRDGS